MENSDLKFVFNNILSKNISSYFKPFKYKRQGNNFKYYDKEQNFGKIINFQKSQFSQINFVINIGIYIPEFEYYFYKIPKISNEKFTEPICAIRTRIGNLKNESDIWYELKEKTDIDKLVEDLENDIKNYVIPFLKNFVNKKYIFEQIFMKRYYGNYEIARIKTLYKNGFKENIINIIGNENYQWKYKGVVLDKINDWIENN